MIPDPVLLTPEPTFPEYAMVPMSTVSPDTLFALALLQLLIMAGIVFLLWQWRPRS